MKINIDFFDGQIIDAIGAGVYQIDIKKGDKVQTLYVGESKHVIKRCGEHLYDFSNDIRYFGFTEESINDNEITLIFRIIEKEEVTCERTIKERNLISLQNPLSQVDKTYILEQKERAKNNRQRFRIIKYDDMKRIEDKIKALNEFLKNSK